MTKHSTTPARRCTAVTTFVLGVLLAMPVLTRAESANDAPSTPKLADPALVEAGRQRFDQACTYCHGKEGAGGKTKSFKGRNDLKPQNVFDTIANGRRRGANIMPPWKNALSEAQIWELVAYILALSHTPASE